jgi:hypothetical protein
MNFSEIVVFLLLAPPVLAKLARLLEAKRLESRNGRNTNVPEPSAATDDVPRVRQGRKRRRARRQRRVTWPG